MPTKKSKLLKNRLHVRNRNRERYDLTALVESVPELSSYLKPNKIGEPSVDFSNPKAVKLLNKALLKHYYEIDYWEFPDENLCPPIPGRADYLHYMADLLSENNFGKIPKGEKITCLDIGTGASCIYPILGVTEYQWNFIASEIDKKSLEIAENIVQKNERLIDKIECRLQQNSKDAFYGIIRREDKIDMSICNPPFHASIEAAQKGSSRKFSNLIGKKSRKPILNFSGNLNELVCEGGENRFIQNMIRESEKFAKNCFWFSTLVSKQSNLKGIYKSLEINNANQIKTIPMGTGNKSNRIVAWSFLNKEERKEWKLSRWS